MKRTLTTIATIILLGLPGTAQANEGASIEGPENFTTKAGWLFADDLEASWRNPHNVLWEAVHKPNQANAVQALTYWREGEYEKAQTIAVRGLISAGAFYLDVAWLPTGIYDARLTVMWEGANTATQPNSVVYRGTFVP